MVRYSFAYISKWEKSLFVTSRKNGRIVCNVWMEPGFISDQIQTKSSSLLSFIVMDKGSEIIPYITIYMNF